MARSGQQQKINSTEKLPTKKWVAAISAIFAFIASLVSGVLVTYLNYVIEPFGKDAQAFVEMQKNKNAPVNPVVDIRAEVMGVGSSRAWLPNIDVKPDDLSFASNDNPSERVSKINELGGYVYGGKMLRINVSSSQTNAVRITDIVADPATSCFAPAPGSAVVLEPEEDPRGYAGAGHMPREMWLSVDAANSQVFGEFSEKDEEGNEKSVTRPYFGPGHEFLTVSEGDSEELQLELSAERLQCNLSLSMTVEEEDGTKHIYPIPLPGKNNTLVVAPNFDRDIPVSGKAYLGAEVCGTVREVDPAVLQGYPNQYDCHKTPPPPSPIGSA